MWSGLTLSYFAASIPPSTAVIGVASAAYLLAYAASAVVPRIRLASR
jgi:hypothetical protein